MLRDLLDGVFNYFKVFKVASEYKLWKYLFYSGLISTFIGACLFYSAFQYGDIFGQSIFSWYKWDFGKDLISAIDDWVGIIIIAIFGVLIFKYIVLIVSSPIMSFLSEQYERQTTSFPALTSFSFLQVFQDLKRGVLLNLRNLFRELFIVGMLMVVGIFPVFTLFVAPLIFIVQSYFAGFGNLDYFLERHHDINGAVSFVKRYRFLAIGNGAVFLLLLMIPVLGWFIAPFFATLSGTIGAISRRELKN